MLISLITKWNHWNNRLKRSTSLLKIAAVLSKCLTFCSVCVEVTRRRRKSSCAQNMHKIWYSKVGQWKRANRAVIIKRDWTRIDPQVKNNVEEDKCSVFSLRNDLAVVWYSELGYIPWEVTLCTHRSTLQKTKLLLSPGADHIARSQHKI